MTATAVLQAYWWCAAVVLFLAAFLLTMIWADNAAAIYRASQRKLWSRVALLAPVWPVLVVWAAWWALRYLIRSADLPKLRRSR